MNSGIGWIFVIIITTTTCYSSLLVATAASLLPLANKVENIDRGQVYLGMPKYCSHHTTKNAPSSEGFEPPPIIHDSLGFWESIPQTASRSVQPFLQNSRLWPTNGRYIRNNWPHLMLCIAMQPHNNNNSKDFIPPYAAFSEVFVSRRRK